MLDVNLLAMIIQSIWLCIQLFRACHVVVVNNLCENNGFATVSLKVFENSKSYSQLG